MVAVLNVKNPYDAQRVGSKIFPKGRFPNKTSKIHTSKTTSKSPTTSQFSVLAPTIEIGEEIFIRVRFSFLFSTQNQVLQKFSQC